MGKTIYSGESIVRKSGNLSFLLVFNLDLEGMTLLVADQKTFPPINILLLENVSCLKVVQNKQKTNIRMNAEYADY